MTKHRNTKRYKKRHHKRSRKGGRSASNSPSNNHSNNLEYHHRDDEIMPPLIIAVLNSDPDMVRMLLDHGVDTRVRDRNGNSALDLARFNGNDEIITMLNRSFSPVNIISPATAWRQERDQRRQPRHVRPRPIQRTRLEDQNIPQDEIDARYAAGWEWNEDTGGWMRISGGSGKNNKKTGNRKDEPLTLTISFEDIKNEMKNDPYLERLRSSANIFKRDVRNTLTAKRKSSSKGGKNKTKKCYR